MRKPIEVDYDNLNVEELGQEITAAATARTAAAPPAAPAPVSAPGLKARFKGLAFRLLRPLFPLMRVMALPLHEDVAALYRNVEASSRQIDKFVDYIKLLHLLDHNLVVELTKLRLEHEALKSRLRLMEKDVEFLTKRERTVEGRVFPE
jgi:hypothetical protein